MADPLRKVRRGGRDPASNHMHSLHAMDLTEERTCIREKIGEVICGLTHLEDVTGSAICGTCDGGTYPTDKRHLTCMHCQQMAAKWHGEPATALARHRRFL